MFKKNDVNDVIKRFELVHGDKYDNPEDAFQAYKTFKEKCVKELAEKWKDKLTEKVYNALLNYKVK